MTSHCLSISRAILGLSNFRIPALSIAIGLLAGACATGNDEVTQNILHGTIANPFSDETSPIGRDPSDERFVIKSSTGSSEYTIEIPGAARDYDIMIPLAAMDAMSGNNSSDGVSGQPKEIANPATTDREIVSALPQIENRLPGDAAMMDGAFGVGKKNGPSQSPSYTLSIAKINSLYKNRKYEYALIELNNMLAYYPNSPQLHKMKGTVLVKIQNFALAERSWVRALDLSPEDVTLRRGLERLQQRMSSARRQSPAPAQRTPSDIPLQQQQPQLNPQDPRSLPPPTLNTDEEGLAH